MMKKSASELALEEFVRKSFNDTSFGDAAAPKPTCSSNSFHLITTSNNDFHFKHQLQDVMNELSSYDEIEREDETQVLLSKTTPRPTRVKLINDSQSSNICGRGNHHDDYNYRQPKSRRENSNMIHEVGGGGTSGNSSDQDQEAISDEELEDDVGTLVDAAHTLDDPTLLKRLRRMLSNRESARRSRKRKQEHLADLELQAEQLRGENDSLYKQLTNAHQQFRDADTNNRVLKSDVEALRAKVKLAEDMVGRGSLTCSLNQLIQSHLGSATANPINNVNLRRVPNVSPTITVHADDSSPYALTRNSIGINAADAVSCVSDIWP